jgi:hypothetical protein
MAWKSVWKGATGDKLPPVPEKNRGTSGKKFLTICGAGRLSRKRPTPVVVGKKQYGKSQMNKDNVTCTSASCRIQEDNISYDQPQYWVSAKKRIVGFSMLGVLLLVSGCTTQTIFQSSFNSNPNRVGAPPAGHQAVGTITVDSRPGSVLVVAPPPGDTKNENWVQLSTAKTSLTGASMTCLTSQAVALNSGVSVSFLANLYIPSGNTVPIMILSQMTPNGVVTNQFLQLTFWQNNSVKMSYDTLYNGVLLSTNIGTFPRNQIFSIEVVVHIINPTSTTVSTQLLGTGASGSVLNTPWVPIYNASGAFLGLNFEMPSVTEGSYEVSDILGESSSP